VLQRAEFCQLVGKPADPTRALAAAEDELDEALGELEEVLAGGDGPVRLDEAGDLVISPLTAEDVPAEATALKAELTEMLPFAPIVSLLIELDSTALPRLVRGAQGPSGMASLISSSGTGRSPVVDGLSTSAATLG
jgi:hypothetical protein